MFCEAFFFSILRGRSIARFGGVWQISQLSSILCDTLKTLSRQTKTYFFIQL